MILEEYIFTSCFLNDIQGLIEQKKQSGYIYDSAKYILIQFDKFCVENHIDRAIITKELSDTWQSYHADEAKSRRASRMSVLRQLAQYKNTIIFRIIGNILRSIRKNTAQYYQYPFFI